MVAGQQKRRLITSSTISCNLQEQYNTKKKKDVESSKHLLNIKAHISLEWDDNQRKVVARREQIGIAWRDLGPFISPFSRCCRGLADVFLVPPEIFGLEDMSKVLSYEVWATYLSEAERNLLTQFLPKGADVKHVVQSLLTGENLHFGNPLLKWGALLCSGDLHPDEVLSREQCFIANKKAYYFDLQNHHNEMLEKSQKWKERWESCEDPAKDIVQKMWSCSRMHVGKFVSSSSNESRLCKPEANFSESCSRAPVEKECRSNKQNTLTDEYEEQERKGFLDKQRKSLVASDRRKVALNLRKEEKLQKLYVHSGDCAKYMSYFKITRKQHQLVKRIKQSGDGIGSKSLNRVLGDIKSYHVRPYEAYEEEECKRVHEHWTQLANKDIPSAFANWTERQLKRHTWRRSLDWEIAEKKITLDEKREKPQSPLQEQRDNEGTCQYQEASVGVLNCVDDEEHASYCIKSPHLRPNSSLNGHHELELVDKEGEEGSEDILKTEGGQPFSPKILQKTNNMVGAANGEVASHSVKESVIHSSDSHPLQRIPSLNGHCELDDMDAEQEDGRHAILRLEGQSPVVSEFVGEMNPTVDAVEREVFVSSAKDVQVGSALLNMPDSYCHPAPVTHGYTSAGELSLKKPRPLIEQSACLIDLETDILNQEDQETLLHTTHGLESAFQIERDGSFFGSYGNQDRSELQPFLKGQEMLPFYVQERKQLGMQLPAKSNGSLEANHSEHFLEQHQQLLEQRQQVRERDFYVPHIIHKSLNFGGGRCTNRTQESVNVQNWANNPAHVSVPLRTHSNNREVFGQNGFPAEHRAQNGWSGIDVNSTSGQCTGIGGNGDGSLYSVLSQFSNLQTHSSYSFISSNQLSAPARNFVGVGISGVSDAFSGTPQQFNYLRGREATAAAATKANNMSWINLPHQNSGLSDPSVRPFLRSWNH